MASDHDQALLRSDIDNAERVCQKIRSRPWYRILGYQSAASLILLVGGLSILLFRRIESAEITTFGGVVVSALLLLAMALAAWDATDWVRERRAASERLSELQEALRARGE